MLKRLFASVVLGHSSSCWSQESLQGWAGSAVVVQRASFSLLQGKEQQERGGSWEIRNVMERQNWWGKLVLVHLIHHYYHKLRLVYPDC